MYIYTDRANLYENFSVGPLDTAKGSSTQKNLDLTVCCGCSRISLGAGAGQGRGRAIFCCGSNFFLDIFCMYPLYPWFSHHPSNHWDHYLGILV